MTKDLEAFFKRGFKLEGTPFRMGFNPDEKFGLKIGPMAGEEKCADGEGVTTYNIVHTCPPRPPEDCFPG